MGRQVVGSQGQLHTSMFAGGERILLGHLFSSTYRFKKRKKKKKPEIELDLVWLNQRLVSSPRAGIPEGLKGCI